MFIKKNNGGFSLLELSIVIVILSILTVGSINITTGMYHIAKTTETKQKIELIEKAIQAYILENKKLPCPAGMKIANGDSNFGIASCAENSTAGIKKTSNNVLVGTIPVKDLNIETTAVADGWSDKFIYMVSTNYTENNSFLNNSASSSNLINSQFAYAIISNGKNRIGGISLLSNNENTKKMTEATTGEKKNMYNNINSNNITADKDAKTFDDIIVLRNRDVLVQKLDMYDMGCIVDNTLATKMTNAGCENGTYTFPTAYMTQGKVYNYKERQISINYIVENDKQKRCVIECGNYGKFTVLFYYYDNTTTSSGS